MNILRRRAVKGTGRPSGASGVPSLLDRARAGDPQAFADLCEPCRAPVCAYLVRAGLAGEDDAEDVFQDAAIRALRSVRRFSGACSFPTWITSIARNAALDRLRAAAARPAVSLDARAENPNLPSEPRLSDDPTFPTPAPAPAPDAALRADERARAVREALEKLPEGTRSAIVLFYFRQLPYAEIAAALGVPIGTVMSRLHNGKAQLQKLLPDSLREPL
ncbi:MAG: sigma-70 family RNA polymerase sigma factor [Kiritimatiellae bacterium]|nr:sigma-70 family RNA polymerase sigma factor [Kiritimatiellia bacterium]